MAGNPFSDVTREDKGVFPRGSYRFHKTRLTAPDERGVPVPISPDATAFTFTDVRRIEDPDGADVTAAWVTNDIDPGDVADVYDDGHASYVGGEAAPANTGLFHDGAGRIAQKVKVPDAAEVTIGTAGRSYTIFWNVRVGGTPVVDADGENYETFDVADFGTLVFEIGFVSVSQVTAGIETSLGSDNILELILEASSFAEGMLEMCGLDPTEFETLPRMVEQAIIMYTRALILERDASAGRRFESIKEGTKAVKFSGQGSRDLENMRRRAVEMLEMYCKRFGNRKRPRMKVIRHDDSCGVARR